MGDTVAVAPRRRMTWVWVLAIGTLLGLAALGMLALHVGTQAGWITTSSSSGGGEGCWSSGGPDWLFAAVLSLGVATALIGAVWATLGWPDRVKETPEAVKPDSAYTRWMRRYRRWVSPVVIALILFNLIVNWSNAVVFDLLPGMAGAVVLVGLALLVAGRESRRTAEDLTHRRLRTWVVGTLFFVALSCSIGAGVAIIAMGTVTTGTTVC